MAATVETEVKTQEMEDDKIKNELDEIMESNERLRRENALFSAFVWRHNEKTNDVSIQSHAEDEIVDTISSTEYEAIQSQLDINLRLKLGTNEKNLIKNEIEELIVKSEKDIGTLRAVLENVSY